MAGIIAEEIAGSPDNYVYYLKIKKARGRWALGIPGSRLLGNAG
jgi:hypothetical protein